MCEIFIFSIGRLENIYTYPFIIPLPCMYTRTILIIIDIRCVLSSPAAHNTTTQKLSIQSFIILLLMMYEYG